MFRLYLSIFFLSSSASGFLSPHLFRAHSSTKEYLLRSQSQHIHSSVVSPFTTKQEVPSEGGLDRLRQDLDNSDCHYADNILAKLCHSLHAKPKDLLRFESTPDGVRGVYLNKPVNDGDVILSIPLESCLADDTPPSWMLEEEALSESSYNPSGWATRLAASLIDLQLRKKECNLGEGHSLWLSLLPEPEYLKRSLPVHWPEDTVQNARSTSLELAVDSAYFARAEATEHLMKSLKYCTRANELSDDELREMCSNTLDLVQTRSCRLEFGHDGRNFGPPLRVLAPIFDFINLGSIKCGGDSGANARFRREGGIYEEIGGTSRLVVRATADLRAGEEVLIDYGESARPAWKCLLSYGFVPQYNRIPSPGESTDDDDDDDENLAEVYMDGARYEVGPSSIPVEMVAAATASMYGPPDLEMGELEEIEITLSPEVALRIARRLSDVAYHLLLEPERDMYDDHPAATPTPFQVMSNKLASSLRWSQHRILLACALGLREFATEANSYL